MDERFELIIDVQSKGIRATERDVLAAEQALNALNAQGKVTATVFDAVNKQLVAQQRSIRDGANQWKVFTQDLQGARKAQIDLKSAMAANTTARSNRSHEAEIQSLSRVEQAQRRLIAARKELYNSNRAVSRANESGNIERQTAAYQRNTAAVNAVASAERNLVAVRRQAAEQAARLQSSLSRAQGGLAVAREDNSLVSEFAGLKQLERAQQQVAVAVRRRTEAEHALQRATASGDVRARIQATKDLTSAIQAQTRAQQHAEQSLSTLRYANYDLGNTLLRTSAITAAVGTAAVVAAGKYERSFADVERTLDPTFQGVSGLRDELLQMSREIPVAFSEIAKGATLGNQLGIAADEVTGFTETVIQFSAVSGVSVEETALAFGQLENLLPGVTGNYDRLGASIALVGVNSAATESQIISVAREIAPAAASAGFAAHEVIGLSGALSSLKVPPERSRSTILQFFETLNMAVANGGEELDNFARVVGVSAADLQQMVATGQGKSILERFIGNVSESNTVEVTQALQELGLSGLRTNPTIRALAGNMDLLNSAMADGKRGWGENTELQRQYAIILDTIASKWQIFLNALMGFGAATGSSVLPAFKLLLDVASTTLNTLADFATSPFGQTLFSWVGSLLAFATVWGAVRGGIALATGAALAFRTATSFLAGAGLAKSVLGLAGALNIYTPAAHGAARGSWAFAAGLKAIGRATIVIGLLQLLFELLVDTEGAVRDVGVAFREFGNFLSDFMPDIPAFQTGAIALQDWGKSIIGWSKTLPGAKDDADDLSTSAKDVAAQIDAYGYSADDAADSTAGLAEEVRTLTDYASDLGSVFDRIFDLNFGAQAGLDAIQKQWSDIAKANEEARRAAAGYKVEITGLKADKAMLQYWLTVAEAYGDEKRAAQIRAELAAVNQDLAETQAKLKAEQDKANKSLTGSSDAAIANRAAVTGLVDSGLAYLQTLAANGASTAELEAEAARLKAQLYAQGAAMGFSKSELDKYAAAFDNATVAIKNVPRNITVEFDGDPAILALREFAAKAKTLAGNLGTSMGNSLGSGLNDALDGGLASFAEKVQTATDLIFDTVGQNYSRTGRKGGGGTFYSGGYTGPGGMYEPAGIVHRGEYVVPKREVNQRTGLPYADALGRLQRGAAGRQGYSGGGYVNPRSSSNGHIASFGPMAQMQLQAALQQILMIDGAVLNATVGRQNAVGTSVGSR